MVEQEDTDNKQPTGKEAVTDPLPAPNIKDAPLHAKDEKSAAENPENNSSKGSKKTLDLLSRLSLSEWLTFLVGFGSLFVSVLAWRTASDSTDIKAAISNLSTLAEQTKRQADALSGQLAAVRDQVSALREQTKAIASQTEAIRASSDAAVKSANAATAAAVAEKQMAETTAAAHSPAVDLYELSIFGLKQTADKNGIIHPVINWAIRNVGGSAFTVKSAYWGVIEADALPGQIPNDGIYTDGAGMVVASNNPSSVFSAQNWKLQAAEIRMDAILTLKTKVFFFAVITYFDGLKVEHHKCFGRQLFFDNDGASTSNIPVGGPAYQCAD